METATSHNDSGLQKIAIRHSVLSDIPSIMPVYEAAKAFMRLKGNAAQWTGGYPSTDVIAADIDNGNHYVGIDSDGRIAMVFAFITGPDPTYAVIEDGRWPDDTPYGTIHRIASAGIHPGMLARCVDFCFETAGTIRIDTHADNAPMLSALDRLGFKRCGIIRLADGSPRIAFQKHKPILS